MATNTMGFVNSFPALIHGDVFRTSQKNVTGRPARFVTFPLADERLQVIETEHWWTAEPVRRQTLWPGKELHQQHKFCGNERVNVRADVQ